MGIREILKWTDHPVLPIPTDEQVASEGWTSERIFKYHKDRLYGPALGAVGAVESDDWRIAGKQWLEKRKRNWEKKDANTENSSAEV